MLILGLGDFHIMGYLGAHPIALGKAEEPAEAQIGIEGYRALARDDFSNPLRWDVGFFG